MIDDIDAAQTLAQFGCLRPARHTSLHQRARQALTLSTSCGIARFDTRPSADNDTPGVLDDILRVLSIDGIPSVPQAPTRATYTYDLAPGAVSPPMSVPPEIPVTLVGNQLVSGFRGVGQAALLSIPGAGGFIEWVGLHSTSGADITQGFNSAAGTLIVYIDWSHCVRVEVAGSAGSGEIQVRNACGAPRRGVVTLTY